ncbi:hypothetical protein [Bradyrhizobium zhanjiangense]|uniref:hypothetical protein n=1 Tax=Bradyrhizobium zhanjiangense TaxID=1325107 RepID=UPI0030846953
MEGAYRSSAMVEFSVQSNPVASIVFVGRNRRGNWVAREQNGMFGGLFVNRDQALKYALSENGNHPEAVIESSREIELDVHTNPQIAGKWPRSCWRALVRDNHHGWCGKGKAAFRFAIGWLAWSRS